MISVFVQHVLPCLNSSRCYARAGVPAHRVRPRRSIALRSGENIRRCTTGASCCCCCLPQSAAGHIRHRCQTWPKATQNMYATPGQWPSTRHPAKGQLFRTGRWLAQAVFSRFGGLSSASSPATPKLSNRLRIGVALASSSVVEWRVSDALLVRHDKDIDADTKMAKTTGTAMPLPASSWRRPSGVVFTTSLTSATGKPCNINASRPSNNRPTLQVLPTWPEAGSPGWA